MKKPIRQLLKKTRDSISIASRVRAEKKIKNNFIKWLGNRDFHCVGGYYPINSEVNIISILQHIENLGIKVCLPTADIDTMEFRGWKIGEALHKKGNLFEPDRVSRIMEPDLLIVPLLGFDRDGHRIGYGQGFYDRYMKRRKELVKIGVAFSSQEVGNKIPFDDHDEKLDYIITEQEVINVD